MYRRRFAVMEAAKRSAANEETASVLLLMFFLVAVVIIGVGIYYLDPAPCSGKDDNAEYKRNDKGECEFVKCKLGYAVDSEGMCVLDQSGKDCQGTDPNATYATNVSNVCTFVSCNTGYMRGTDGRCVEPKDCVGDWSEWSECSKSCGVGTQSREWIVTEDEVGGGQCPNRNAIVEQYCNTQECPPPCEGVWRVLVECERGCGPETATFTYNNPGSGLCPHSQGDMKYEDCNNPACPTVDTTETIDGVTYEVKFYDDADGHDAYYSRYKSAVYHDGTRDVQWGGVDKGITGMFGTTPNIGNDNHQYLRGDLMNTAHGSTKYVIKRSLEPVEKRVCQLNERKQYDMSLSGYEDFDCAAKCRAQTGSCLDRNTLCDYQLSSKKGYAQYRYPVLFSNACVYLKEGQTQCEICEKEYPEGSQEYFACRTRNANSDCVEGAIA